MNIITFTYTKADGKVSQRVLVPLITPNKMYEGIDISELGEVVDQVQFTLDMEAARNRYLEEIAKIEAWYGVKNQYRRFDPAKMTDIVVDVI